jgi:hypothetical protein
MTMRYESYLYDDELSGFFPVLARATETTSTRYTRLNEAYATGSTGAIRKLVKTFAPGFFAGSGTSTSLVGNRILPRMTTRTATAANATSISFPVGTAGIFIPTDVLSIIAPSVRVTISSASTGWAASDTITVTVNGIAVTYTVVAGDIGGSLTATNTNVAAKVIGAIAANPYTSRLVSGLSVAGTSPAMVIVFWAKDFTSLYSFTTSVSSTNGTSTASAAVFAPNAAIGTISAVNTVTDVVTISAASVSVPLGMPIGVAASSPENLGMLSPEVPIDLLYRESQNYALYLEGDVYGSRLPYMDGQLAALYPEIRLV